MQHVLKAQLEVVITSEVKHVVKAQLEVVIASYVQHMLKAQLEVVIPLPRAESEAASTC